MADYMHGPATSVTIPQEKTQRAGCQTDDIHARPCLPTLCALEHLRSSQNASWCQTLSFQSPELPVLNHWGEPVETSKILSTDGFIHPPGCPVVRIPCNSLWSHEGPG